jgi:hypothetical protein
MKQLLRIALKPEPMSSVKVEVRGENLSDAAKALLGPLGKTVQRQVLSLPAADLEQFRRGEMVQAKVEELVAKVNDWLLDSELRSLLTVCLAGGNGSRTCIVFEVPDESRNLVAEVPFELLWHDTPAQPLVLRKDIEALVYLLAKAGVQMTENPATRSWPFKVLIVRPNPPDLGGQVPEVKTLRDHILVKGAHYGGGMVQVDVLSAEDGIGQPATWDAVQEQLARTHDYSVLVYLGHGELVPQHSGGQPLGQLYLEAEDGLGHKPVSAPQIARLLSKYPIPVVVLTGCLTGAEAPGAPARQRGGEQGVAQALVNSSEAGVQVAVGMRTELRTDAAITFLKAFFTSLLNPTKDALGSVPGGDIDRAVWEGRNTLFLQTGLFPPHWAAPVVFRAVEEEPIIRILAQPTEFQVTRDMKMLLEIRATLWKDLPEQSLSEGTPAMLMAIKKPLLAVEKKLREEGLKHGPMLLPCHAMIGAGQQGEVLVELAGTLRVSLLRGCLAVAGGTAAALRMTVPKAVRDAGFQLLTDSEDQACFELRSRDGTAKVLPEGELLKIVVQVGQTQPGLYAITLDIHEVVPKSIFWPGDNVLVVPRP